MQRSVAPEEMSKSCNVSCFPALLTGYKKRINKELKREKEKQEIGGSKDSRRIYRYNDTLIKESLVDDRYVEVLGHHALHPGH